MLKTENWKPLLENKREFNTGALHLKMGCLLAHVPSLVAFLTGKALIPPPPHLLPHMEASHKKKDERRSLLLTGPWRPEPFTHTQRSYCLGFSSFFFFDCVWSQLRHAGSFAVTWALCCSARASLCLWRVGSVVAALFHFLPCWMSLPKLMLGDGPCPSVWKPLFGTDLLTHKEMYKRVFAQVLFVRRENWRQHNSWRSCRVEY